ncbi:hypothetical protein [Pulveribacter sp.]|uniref:hypothetical protein n=1 Tax=Pulveribacter sp. TaxID=2678893 RepID=UPI0028B19BF1|nr:hypothetical protein [Pulveribacter sp.]
MSTLAYISFAALVTCSIFLLGALCGWVYAHGVIAAECERLGGFYVGTNIYECKRVDAPVNRKERQQEVMP